MRISKKFIMALLALTILSPAILSAAQGGDDVVLLEARDLSREGEEAQRRGLPILIMFSMEHCPYCEIVREEFLKPMLRSGDYDNKVIMREIQSDSFETLRDFDGKAITADALAHRYNASLSPTVVFLDPDGRELVSRLVGITTVHYYGGFLDEAIEQSLQRMRSLALNQLAD